MEENVLVFRKHPLKYVGIQLTFKWPRKSLPGQKWGVTTEQMGQERNNWQN